MLLQTLVPLFPALLAAPLACALDSTLLGYVAVASALTALGFGVAVYPFCYCVGWDSEDKMVPPETELLGRSPRARRGRLSVLRRLLTTKPLLLENGVFFFFLYGFERPWQPFFIYLAASQTGTAQAGAL